MLQVVLVCCSRRSSHGSSLAGQYNLPLWRCGAVVLCRPQNIDNWSPAEHTHTHTHTQAVSAAAAAAAAVCLCLCLCVCAAVRLASCPGSRYQCQVRPFQSSHYAALRPGPLLLLLLHWRLARILLLQLTALHRVNSSKCS